MTAKFFHIKSNGKGGDIRNVLTLVSGSAVAQAISFVFSMLLARLYTPESFGILSVFTSLLGFMSVFSAGKYDMAIVVTKNKEHVSELIRLTFYIALCCGFFILLLSVPAYFFPFKIMGLTAAEKIFLFPLGLALFFNVLAQVFWMTLTREKRFKELSVGRITESLSNNLIATAGYMLGTLGLINAYFFSQLSLMTFLLTRVKKLKFIKSFAYNKEELIATAKEYSEFPKINILQGLLDMYQMMAVVLIGVNFFTLATMGLYAMAMRVLQVPVWLVVRPISNVLFSRASEDYRNNKPLLPLAKKSVLLTLAVGIPFTAIIYFFAPYLFSLLFGMKWEASGELAGVLAVWMFFDIIRSPISQLPTVIGKQRSMLYISVIGAIIVTVSIIIAGLNYNESINQAFLIISCSQAFSGIIAIIAVFVLISREDSSLIKKQR